MVGTAETRSAFSKINRYELIFDAPTRLLVTKTFLLVNRLQKPLKKIVTLKSFARSINVNSKTFHRWVKDYKTRNKFAIPRNGQYTLTFEHVNFLKELKNKKISISEILDSFNKKFSNHLLSRKSIKKLLNNKFILVDRRHTRERFAKLMVYIYKFLIRFYFRPQNL